MHCPPPDGAVDPPVVVCVHGWGCSAYSYNRVLREIADAGCDVYAPDVRGHGWSDKPLALADYAPDALGRWLLAVLDALGLARVVLVGHSMGGGVVVRAALQAPERIVGLVLLAPVGFGAIPRTRLLRWLTPGLLDPLLPRLATRAVIGLGLRTGYGAIGAPTDRDVDEYWAPTADPAFARATRLVAHAFEWELARPAELSRLACPVHAILGGRDHLVPGSHLRAHAERIPRLRLDEVPDAGHVLAEEVPELVVRAVVEDARAWWHPPSGPG
ncbi:alpha/beta hydrolase [Roseisolibacter sp. H3M3-2]|uniref:alpha/beta fold hydrolase n=1 Tax=Roseisolibacter sp. H3M3-2 TaxID=3031323 RepID=UPI0023DADD9B|nr:alpha/beta hydrolase [Roseisolibacter sp. H3M3-2]MDF1503931.1 alpha/beta hydrolase [Roseisolibacter sp. H3M3-2]